jgi:hypothetical protein
MLCVTNMTQSNLPLALQPLTQHKNWVNWIAIPTEDGKTTKPPINPITRNGAMPNNPNTWATYQQAIDAVDKYDFEGVGFMCYPPNIKLVGVDLDGCMESGNLTKFASEIVEMLPCYWEVSPSGRGLHGYMLGELPKGKRRNDNLGIEMYQEGRYFTITGNQVTGSADELVDCTDELAELHAMIFGAGVAVAQAPKPVYRPVLTLSDEEMKQKAMNARNGAKFKALFNGDISSYNNDDSRADLGLCAMLAYYCDGDAAVMDRLFRQSELMRPKWDEKKGELTYGQMTIDKAIANSQNYMQTAKKREGNAKAIERKQTVNTNKEVITTGFGAEWDKLAADNPCYEFVVTSERYILEELVKRLLTVAFEGTGEGDIARLYIKSGLGTGKTSILINELAKAYNQLRLYGHRRELIRNMAQSVGITSQQEIEKLADGDFKGGDKLAMVINSIINLKYALPDNEIAEAVVVDEIEQVLGSIVAGTVTAKEATYSELLQQLNNATLSALVDADLSPLTVEYLNRDYQGKTVILLNQYQPYQNRKAYIYEDKGNCLGNLLADIEAGERVICAMGGSIEEGNAIIRQCLAVKADLKWIYVNERTAKALTEFTMGLKDGSFKAYDLVMYSPVWQAGVDLNDRESGHFHKAYAFMSKIHTSKEAWQMIGRLRSEVDIHLYCPTAGNYRKSLTKSMIIKEKKAAYQSERKHLKRIAMYTPLNIEMSDNIEMTECINLQIDLLLQRNNDLAELRANIVQYGEWLGCEMKTVGATAAGANYRWELKELREEVRSEYQGKVADTFTATPMGAYEAAVIEKTIGKIDMDDRLRYEGFKVASLYCPNEPVPVITQTMVATYQGDKAQAETLLHVLLSDINQAEKTLKQTGMNFLDMRHYVTAWTHKRAILEMLGVKFTGEFGLDVSAVLFSHTSLWAGPLPEYLMKHYEELNGCGLMGATVTDKTLMKFKKNKEGKEVANEGLTRYVSHILESMGLNPTGHGKKGRTYRILSEQAERMVKLARQLHGARDISIEVNEEPDAPLNAPPCCHDEDNLEAIPGGVRCECGAEWTYYGWLYENTFNYGLIE